MLPSNPSGSQMGWGSSQCTYSGSYSYDMPLPTQGQGYRAAPGSITITQHLSPTPMTYPLQNQVLTTMAMTNISDVVPSEYQLATSNSSCLNSSPNPTSEQLPPSMPFINSVSFKQSQPLYNSTLINSRGLTQPFPLAYQNAGSTEAQAVNKVIPDPASSLPAQFLPYSASSGMDQVSNFSVGASNLSLPRLSECSPSNNLYAEQKDATDISLSSLNFLSSAAGPAVQPALLPLPPASQKVSYLVCFISFNTLDFSDILAYVLCNKRLTWLIQCFHIDSICAFWISIHWRGEFNNFRILKTYNQLSQSHLFKPGS